MSSRYGEERIIEVKIVSAQKVGPWYDFYSDRGVKLSSRFASVGERVHLGMNKLRVVNDYRSEQIRIMKVEA